MVPVPLATHVLSPFGPLVPEQRPLPGSREAEYLNRCLQLGWQQRQVTAAPGHSPPPSPDYGDYLSNHQDEFFGEPRRSRPQQQMSHRRQQQIHDAEDERRMMRQFLKIDLVRRCLDLEKPQVQDQQFVEWRHHQQQLDQQLQKRDKQVQADMKKAAKQRRRKSQLGQQLQSI
jgi:hypothetical protein